jgi:hypothetical protein
VGLARSITGSVLLTWRNWVMIVARYWRGDCDIVQRNREEVSRWH